MSRNTPKIAQREFLELLNNRLMYFIMLFYLLVLLTNAYSTYIFSGGQHGQNVVFNEFGFRDALHQLLYVFVNCGSLIAIIIGHSSLTSEKHRSALNVLISKPIFRESIINGKLISSVAFILLTFVIANIAYFILLALLYGKIINVTVQTFFSEIIIIYLIAALVTGIYVVISLIMILLIKDTMFSLFSALLIWIVSIRIFPSSAFSASLSYAFGDNSQHIQSMIANISPQLLVLNIFNKSDHLINNLSQNDLILKLVITLVVLLVLSYILFNRRDTA